MEIFQIEYALAVAKYHNFSRAAEEVHLTRSALSQQIRKLERELGVDLFRRSTRSVELTDAGMEFVKIASGIIGELEGLKNTMHEYACSERGQIAVGHFPGMEGFGIPDCLVSFQKTFRNVEISYTEAECQQLVALIEQGEIDVAFLTAADKMLPKGVVLEAYPMVTDFLGVEVSRAHPFAAREAVSWKELQGERLLAPPMMSGIALDIEEICRKNHLKLNISTSNSSNSTYHYMVAGDLGVYIMTRTAWDYEGNKGTVCIPLEPRVQRTVSLVLPLSEKRSQIVAKFTAFCVAWADNPKPVPLSPKANP